MNAAITPAMHAAVVGAESLVELQTGTDGPPIFLFHPLQGDVLCYQQLVAAYGAGQAFYGLQARGLTADVAPAASMTALAQEYVAEMLSVQPDGPYYLAGWSLGALVALEAAHLLRRQGRQVGMLLSIDFAYSREKYPVPDPLKQVLGFYDDMDFLFLCLFLQESFTVDFYYHYLRLKDNAQRMAALIQEALRTARFGPAAQPQQVARLTRLQKANYDIGVVYEPEPGDLPAYFLMASEQMPLLGQGGAALRRRSGQHPATRVIRGCHHMNIIAPPYVRQVALQLRTIFNQAVRKTERAPAPPAGRLQGEFDGH
ncbi:hypothetical protein GTP91_31110 [Rugamonas sp. FT82W]|uniref:Thioesterase domain-containing protein n=1 Tax=Duganella vulcania TaxID=2692166 RepID=A0A845GBE7_9BURK|nr:thioesterase domain-containing protein [Duganella vulcania]MYM91614.1 hypothetical protein [Duganella vulcania]